MTEHSLKCAPEYFQALWDGAKTAELRRDDRGFAVGDVVVLMEWDEATAKRIYDVWQDHWTGAFTAIAVVCAEHDAAEAAYTGRRIRRTITHITRGAPWLCEGYVMLSLGDTS